MIKFGTEGKVIEVGVFEVGPDAVDIVDVPPPRAKTGFLPNGRGNTRAISPPGLLRMR